jgi:hypothetical protein
MFSPYYNTNGIPTERPLENSFWVQETAAGFVLKEGDITYDIDAACIRLRDRLAAKIFGHLSTYHALLPTIAIPYFYGGIDAEVNVSKEEFEKFATTVSYHPMHNQLLYFYDVGNLISTLQNSVAESKHLMGQFFKTLNMNSFLIDPNIPMVEEGLQYAAGAIVTNITSTVNHLFINLYSQLDFITKIAYEFEHLSTDFTSYPKLASKDKLFGDAKRISLNALPGSIYEASVDVKCIMALRNEIVHNSSIDSIPKVYQVMKDKKIIEKYILLPDLENGFIKSFKNRKRFFNQDVKLNNLLPQMMQEFWKRVLTTVSVIR